jgi:hypothetical protein
MSDFILTEENYYTPEADMRYVSVSQYKRFIGSVYSNDACEAAALADAKGEIERKPTTAMMIGSYVDEALTGDLEKFKAEHPEIFSSRGATAGQLKSEYIQAEAMVERARKDETFMAYVDGGDHQVIMTGDIEGVPFKIKIDHVARLNGESVAIVDLKTVRSMDETFRVPDSGEFITWVEKWNYDLQGAVYQFIYAQNTGLRLPFYIAAISKDKDSAGVPHPRLKIIQVPQTKLDERLSEVKQNIKKVQMIKSGEIEPVHCGHCDYCADKLPCSVISMDELILGA